jgi:hypothetical protein
VTLAGAEEAKPSQERIPQIKEGDHVPWLEYYRRERGKDWPAQPGGIPGRAAGDVSVPGKGAADEDRGAPAAPADR